MASPNTLMMKRRIEESATKIVAEIVAERAEFKPRTSHRWMGRTKGLPFSRMKLIDTIPQEPGKAALLVVDHPTRRRGRKNLTATPELLRVFYPSLPAPLADAMLGFN